MFKNMTSDQTFIPLSIPQISGNEWYYVKECLDTGWVSSVGSYVNRFEEDLAKYVGSSYAVATVNGTAALHISLMLLGVNVGDEVLVPTLTFIAPVNSVRYVGANPIFIDCDEHLNIDAVKLVEFCEKECTFNGKYLVNKSTGNRVRAIILVHVFGHPVDIEPIKSLADKFSLKIIEDATESLGSFYKNGPYAGMKTGTIGEIGCYSFNGNKIITTGGGGMMVTNSKQLADKARYFTTQAKDDAEMFLHNNIGYNYRLTNVQAAIGCAQLEQLDEYVRIKRKNFDLYQERLADVAGLKFVKEPKQAHSNYWHYTLLVDEKGFGLNSLQLRQRLKKNGIESRPIWELNHRQKPYENFQTYKIERAMRFRNEGLNIPCSVSLSPDSIRRICATIKGEV